MTVLRQGRRISANWSNLASPPSPPPPPLFPPSPIHNNPSSRFRRPSRRRGEHFSAAAARRRCGCLADKRCSLAIEWGGGAFLKLGLESVRSTLFNCWARLNQLNHWIPTGGGQFPLEPFVKNESSIRTLFGCWHLLFEPFPDADSYHLNPARKPTVAIWTLSRC
jgi:hypothetical protein